MSESVEENEEGAAISAPGNLCDSLNFNQGSGKMQKSAPSHSTPQFPLQSEAQLHVGAPLQHGLSSEP